jgi:hypothetical protein
MPFILHNCECKTKFANSGLFCGPLKGGCINPLDYICRLAKQKAKLWIRTGQNSPLSRKNTSIGRQLSNR